MKPETESSVSKAKTKRKAVRKTALTAKKKSVKRAPDSAKDCAKTSAASKNVAAAAATMQKRVTDLEFLDTVKETVYRKLLDNELDLKIDSGFKAIELKNKISETSDNERLLLEILSEIRSDELNKAGS
jgi:hypothetical protein